MRIGIDIDGVLTDIETWQLDYGSKFFYEKYDKDIVNYKGYEEKEIFNVKQELDDEFWDKYFEEYSVNIEPRRFANEITKKLKEDGHEIYIITARGTFLLHSKGIITKEKNQEIVLNWLNKNDIYYDKIIFSPEDKLDICIENNIDIMIEDKVQNIEKISTKIPVICFHADYNENCKGRKIYNAYSWYEIYMFISEVIKKL
jgi:uncharacterized HAD superfamily protein